MKTLYFEGAGCVPCGDLENCRIRTAFTLDSGNKIYLEITAIAVDNKHTAASLRNFTNCAFIDHCYYITGCHEDCNENVHPVERKTHFEYNRENLLKFVNSLGASFDEVVILPDLAGYRVHADNRGYNFADEFYYDVERTEQAEKIKQYFYDFEKNELGKKYPNFSIYFKDDILRVLIHYNGFNDIVEIPDVYAFGFDYKKPEGATVAR